MSTFFSSGATPISGPRPPHYRGFKIRSDTSHSVGILWTGNQQDAETSIWQHTTLARDSHIPIAIRTQNPSKRTSADPRLTQRGRWDRQNKRIQLDIYFRTVCSIADTSRLMQFNFPLGPAQIENKYTYGRLQMSTQKDSSFSLNSKALEPHWPRHDCPPPSSYCTVILHRKNQARFYKKMWFFLVFFFAQVGKCLYVNPANIMLC
jgi:hypothetical protein